MSENQKKVLVIEDNKDLSHILAVNIEELGCVVDSADDGIKGLRKAETNIYDLIILDLMLPGLNGLEICKTIRGKGLTVPVLILTAKSSEMDRVLGLELGADDYVIKPFSIMELMARVKSIFRRTEFDQAGDKSVKEKPLQKGRLNIDPERRKVILTGTPVDLTAKEFDLLYYFASHPGRVFSRSQLLDTIWGYGHSGYEHTVNSHINRLRSKIEANPNKPLYIITVWGVGYKFTDDQNPEGEENV